MGIINGLLRALNRVLILPCSWLILQVRSASDKSDLHSHLLAGAPCLLVGFMLLCATIVHWAGGGYFLAQLKITSQGPCRLLLPAGTVSVLSKCLKKLDIGMPHSQNSPQLCINQGGQILTPYHGSCSSETTKVSHISVYFKGLFFTPSWLEEELIKNEDFVESEELLESLNIDKSH